MTNRILLLTILLLASISLQAQKAKIYEGNFDALVGEKELVVEFTYDDLVVGKKSENDYVTEKVEEKNKEEAGTGDVWLERWVDDRDERFEPKFIELFNKQVKEKGLEITRRSETAKYKLLVWTTKMEPGFNVGIVRRNAHINVEYWLYDIATEEILAKAKMEKIQGQGGMGLDFEVARRMEESYAKGGKSFGKFLRKKVLKENKMKKGKKKKGKKKKRKN